MAVKENKQGNTAQRTIAILKAQPWMPVQGEMRTAQLVTVRKQDDSYGGHIVLVMESAEHGIFAYHVFSTLEQQNLSELKPVKGSTLTIYNGGKRETNASRRSYQAYEELVKAGSTDAKEPERTFYHDNLILAGDGSDLPTEEYSWE
jgi:hypothetical protein